MRKLSINDLHRRLFEVDDEVLGSGNPVAITHRGKTLLLLTRKPTAIHDSPPSHGASSPGRTPPHLRKRG